MSITLITMFLSGVLLWIALFVHLNMIKISKKNKSIVEKPKCNHKWVFNGFEVYGEYYKCSKCDQEKYDNFGY